MTKEERIDNWQRIISKQEERAAQPLPKDDNGMILRP